MLSPEFNSYLGSYLKVSPLREQFFKDKADGFANFPEELRSYAHIPHADPNLQKIDESEYPEIYEVTREECAFRNVPMPDLYMDEEARLAYANAYCYAVVIEPQALQKFNKQELHALMAHEIKHLYQDCSTTQAEDHAKEYDCDRAAVESTDYATIQSYVSKALDMQIDRAVPTHFLRGLAHAFNKAFPNVLSESFVIELDAEHPSPADRMRAMRIHEQTLNRH